MEFGCVCICRDINLCEICLSRLFIPYYILRGFSRLFPCMKETLVLLRVVGSLSSRCAEVIGRVLGQMLLFMPSCVRAHSTHIYKPALRIKNKRALINSHDIVVGRDHAGPVGSMSHIGPKPKQIYDGGQNNLAAE